MFASRFKSDPNLDMYAVVGQSIEALYQHGIPPETTLKELRALNRMTLAFIERNEEWLTRGQLHTLTGLSKSKVNRMVDEWLEHGWLEESIDPDDTRVRRLHLSEYAVENSRRLTRKLSLIGTREFKPSQRGFKILVALLILSIIVSTTDLWLDADMWMDVHHFAQNLWRKYL